MYAMDSWKDGQMIKKLNPKLDRAMIELAGDHRDTPEWDALLDVVREMLIEMGNDVLRFTEESDGWPPEPQMMRVLADSHIYPESDDERM